MAKTGKAPARRTAGRARAGRGFEQLTVKDIIKRRVTPARLDMKGDKVAALLVKEGCAVAVVDKARRLVGIVSEHDLLSALDAGRAWNEQQADELMSANPYSVRPETTLPTLVHVLTESDLLSAPVVNEADRFLGVVTRRDVLRAALRQAKTRRR
ncbi:MAG: CBS domain-containing protein [Nitrospira sp. CR2.1]|nr:CBS domain-containing protein [Nitrospira sp. CR2.1]